MPNNPNNENDHEQAQDRTWEPQPDGPAQQRVLQEHQSQGGGQRQQTAGVANQQGQTGRDQAGRGSGQQQQFDTQGRGQQGGGGLDSRFVDQIREHQEVVDADGKHLGTVDHVQGDKIKLSRKDSDDGQHHYVLLSQVSGIDGNRVRLRERGDNDFGIET
jgi:hypothetical protein